MTDEWDCDNNVRKPNYFRALFNDVAIEPIVTETNRYYQYITNKFIFKAHSWVHKRVNIRPQEIYVFLALILLIPLKMQHLFF